MDQNGNHNVDRSVSYPNGFPLKILITSGKKFECQNTVNSVAGKRGVGKVLTNLTVIHMIHLYA